MTTLVYSSTKSRDSGTTYAGLYAADQKVFSRARDNIVLGLVCTCNCLQEHLATWPQLRRSAEFEMHVLIIPLCEPNSQVSRCSLEICELLWPINTTD